MAIRTRLKVVGTPIKDEITALDALTDMMIQGAKETLTVIEPHWLDEAQYYPPPAKLPFQFATEKSRRWYFANKVDPRQPRGRYIRTGALKRSFFMHYVQQNSTVQFVLGSDSDITKWVMGSFDRSRNYQVPGHRNTGWPQIAPTADFWLDATEEEYFKRMPTIYANFEVNRRNR